MLWAVTVKAQNPMAAAEAKAAYILAEEQFAASNYTGALSYLKTATERLGAANSKILYLQIMAQHELSRTDKSYRAKVDSSIAQFEKAADLAQFNEEKTFEIVKLKLQLREQLAANERFKKFILLDLPLGLTFEEAKLKKPELFKSTGSYNPNTKTGYIQSGNNWFHFKNGRLFYIAKSIYNYGAEGMARTKNEIYAMLDQIKSETNTAPTEKVVTNTTNCTSVTNTYTWQSGSRTIVLMMIAVTGAPCGEGALTGSITITDTEFQ